jgi:hypothetical protein
MGWSTGRTLGASACRTSGISTWRTLGACILGTIRARPLLASLSRCIPTRYSPWSSRHHLVIPENPSRHELTSSLVSGSIGTLSRKHAPEGDVSSILAGAVCTVSSWSSHVALTTAIIALLGSNRPRVVLSRPIISAASKTGSTPLSPQHNSIFQCFHPSGSRSPFPLTLNCLLSTVGSACVPPRNSVAWPSLAQSPPCPADAPSPSQHG